MALHEHRLLGHLARILLQSMGHSTTPDVNDEVGSSNKGDRADGKDLEHGVGLENYLERFHVRASLLYQLQEPSKGR